MKDFERLVEPLRSRLRLHCYRMLGSSHDADDMVQETLMRAFRSRDTLHDPDAVRPWLYRIATNVCLDELQKRPRRARGPELGPPSEPDIAVPTFLADDEWLEPCPSAWLVGTDPGAEYSLKESVALAFVAALQVLTPAQRAVLLLRDVVGLSAEETARALDSSVSAANSALHRARVALEERVGPRASWSPDEAAPVDVALLERYMHAWERGDLATIVALLHDEASISMPPAPIWIEGGGAVGRFFAIRLGQALAKRAFRTRACDANGAPAIAFYRGHDDGRAHLFGIHVPQWREGRIVRIDHFMTKSGLGAFLAAGIAPSTPM